MLGKENKQVKTISIVVVLTLIGKIMGLARDMLLGYYFATGMEANAFLTASRIPRNFFDVIFASAISSCFIPVFNECLERKGKKDAFDLTNAFITLVAILTVVISAIGIIFSGPLVGFLADGFDSQTATLSASLLKIMFPAVVFTGLAFSVVGVLQSFGEFNIPALLSAATNFVIIIYYIFFRSRFGIVGLAVAFLIGWAAQLVIQLPSLKKLGYRYRPALKHDGLKKILIMMLPILVSTWSQPVNAMVAGKFASHLNGGAATSAFDFANTLYTIIAGVLVLSISNVMFPEFSRMSSKGDDAALKESISSTLNGMMFLIVPMAFGLCAVSKPLIRLFYERGAWGPESTQLTASALAVLAIGMIAYGLQVILSRVFYAQQKSLVPLLCGIVAVASNVLLCIYLTPRFGIMGIAAASVVSILLSDLVLLKAADKRFCGILDNRAMIDFFKVFISSAVMGVVVFFAARFLEDRLSDNLITRCIVLFVPVVCGIIVYFIMSLILGVEIIKRLDLGDKLRRTSLYKLYRRFCDFMYREWNKSAIVTLVCSPKGRLWNEETNALPFWKKLCEGFNNSKLKKLFEGSVFLQSYIWAALAVFAAPILPTMADLALCMASYFSMLLSSLNGNKARIKKSPLTIPAVIYAVLFIAATLLSKDIKSSSLVCVLTVAFVIYASILYYSVETKKQFDILIDLLILAAALISCYGILQYIFGWGYQSGAWIDESMFSGIGFRVVSTLENPNMLGHYLILTVPLGGARFLSSKGRRRFYYFCCCAVMVLCMIFTFSRGAWLGLMCAALIFVALIKPQLLLLAPVALLVLYLVLPDTIIERFTSIGNMSDRSTSYRVSIWMSSLAMLKDGNWMTGIGPGNEVFSRLFNFYAQDLVIAPHSHNLFLQLACEGGILLLIVFIVIVLIFVRMMLAAIGKEKDQDTKLVQSAIVSGVIGFLVQGMTDYSFYNKRLMLMFWMFLAAGALAARRSELKDGGILK